MKTTRTTGNPYTKTLCLQIQNTLRVCLCPRCPTRDFRVVLDEQSLNGKLRSQPIISLSLVDKRTLSFSDKDSSAATKTDVLLPPFFTRVLTSLFTTSYELKYLPARHKSCFLRPDTGPCRADIIQWYFDVKQKACFRFFWGGCQGNGNRFETKAECHDYCHLNATTTPVKLPEFCQLSFDYGTCFGYFNRWTWDHYSKTCKQRIYSGCGGNQNNFETRKECTDTCLTPPNSTLNRIFGYTTCVPYNIVDML